MNLKSVKKFRVKIFAFLLIISILLANFISISYSIPKLSQIGIIREYLYVKNPKDTFYEFSAKGKCYVIANVTNTDFSNFNIDNEHDYEVSYGFNAIPITFSEKKVHNITLANHNHFQSITIEPIFIAQGNETVGLNTIKVIKFDAGGSISILLKPNFSYNVLYVKLDDKPPMKEKYDKTWYPKIDPQLYSYFIDGGAYIRFDIEVSPQREHILQLKGNGTVEYIIMTNYEWDGDDIPDVLEVQKQTFYDIDPTIPDLWGFFEKSEAEVLVNINKTNQALEGYFSYYIPEPGAYSLKIEVEEGEYFDIAFDGDSTTLKNVVLKGNTSDFKTIVSVFNSGWHIINYKFFSNYNKIKFFLKPTNGFFQEIKILNFIEFLDSDGDGVKDFQENNNNLNYQGSDSDRDGLPDNFDNSPFAFLKLKRNKISRFTIPTNPNKNTIITLNIKKPDNDYSTNGIPRLWRDALNVSIYPVLRLFGNKYQLYAESPTLDLDLDTTSFLWNKPFDSYNLVSGYDSSENVVGDPLPRADYPDNETLFIFPTPAQETWEFQLNFFKDNSAKNDSLLDIRFDFIWLLTMYQSETHSTEILHYYNFEEDIILQAMNMKEIGDVDYLLATPDNFVENQILWTLLQNPTIGSLQEFGVDDDLIAKDTVDYSEIAEQIRLDIQDYYKDQTERNTEAEVSYFSVFQYNYDLLNKYKLSLNESLNSPLLSKRDFQSKFSYYSINNVYKDEDILISDSEVTGDYKTNYIISQNIFNYNQQVATIFDLPIEMERKSISGSNSEILKITKAISEPIPINEIPIYKSTSLHPKIKLMEIIYIEKINFFEQIPKVTFDINTDIEKFYYDNRADELDRGELFFKDDTISPSPAKLLIDYIDSLRVRLKELHDLYSYFNTNEGKEYCSAEIFNPYREFDSFLNNYKDENDDYLTGFLKKDVKTKLRELNNLELKIPEMEGQERDVYIEKRINSVPEALVEALGTIGKILTKTKHTAFSLDILKLAMKEGKNYGAYAYKGAVKGKLASEEGCWTADKIRNNVGLNALVATYQVIDGVITFVTSLSDLIKTFLKEHLAPWENLYNFTMWFNELVISACNVVLSTVSVIQGFITFIRLQKDIWKTALKSVSSFLSKVTLAIGIIFIIVDWVDFIFRVTNGEYEGRELLFQIINIVATTIVSIVSLYIAAAASTTGYGIIVGIAIALLTLLGIWLSAELNNPSIDVQSCSIYFDEATKLKLRRQGSLEVGDHVNYHLKVVNDGDTNGWIRSRFRLQENKSGGWTTGWDGWYGDGDWSAELWPWYSFFNPNEVFEKHFSVTIPEPTTNLHYRFELEFDWERFELIIIIPTWWRTEGAREYYTEETRMPVLDNNIADFYNDTKELMSTTLLKQEFEKAINEYRWKDASDVANKIISRTQDKAGTPSDEFYRLNENKQVYNESYYLYHTSSNDEFYSLIEDHYETGFLAKVPVPKEIWYPNRALGPKMRHMLSYDYSNGDLLIPRDEENWINDWFYIKLQELGDAAVYSQLLEDLPIKTNIRTDLRKNPLDIDPETKKCYTNFQLFLEGPDNPDVDYIISQPVNFSITPTSFTQTLRENISFTITQENPHQIMGLYLFEMNITLNDKIIYSTLVPIRIKSFSHIDYISHIPVEPIYPGEIFNLLDVVNLGTISEGVILMIEGVPENFIYKDLYPNEFLNSSYKDLLPDELRRKMEIIPDELLNKTQLFNLKPGDVREGFVINPPMHYSTAPGLYEFNVTAINPTDNRTYFIYQGSFEIEIIHNIQFVCNNPNILIYDSESATYIFEVTNLGNIDEHILVEYDEIDFAVSLISDDMFTIAPGETKSFSIIMNPFELGSGVFKVNASSEFVFSEIICSLEVIDDDTNDPYFTNILINDNHVWLNISFEAFDIQEGDDLGLSFIEIYVDNELIYTYYPSPIETSFNFNFINEWIWEIIGEYFISGFITHEINVVIIDADNDRDNDELSAEFYDYFFITLDKMYNYIVWLLEEMNNYIYEESIVALYGVFTQKVVKIQNLLLEAYQLIADGFLHTGLVRNKMAEIKLEIADTKMELMINKQSMNIDHFNYLKDWIQNIRNKIVEIMGRSVGTKFAHELSLQEAEIYNVRDFVEENINETDRESLVNLISLAASKLEDAIFDISLDKDTEASILQSIHALSHALKEVNSLAKKGKITETLKIELQEDILFIQAMLWDILISFI